ncbi:MAG: SDR family oxidoreductase [Maritimibacter sp.]|uniref:SDR family NAD(P)-dependent oxidoreductase n=1 Tax=Maritimibacter sp. TaxID=2003363 RepID=UPI001D5CF8BB|nr:SDR family oxidoreductase [Maritimibacter sp.]MBL6426750.1 SDR family oxidoreductase [Maritimibacter sp.]
MTLENVPGISGKAFVVLGAGQGIGRATVEALSAAGARVACVDRDEGLAQAVAGAVGGLALSGDVTRRGDMERMFQDAADWADGCLGGVVDIVGIADVRAIADMDDEGWNEQFDLTLRHAFLTVQIAPRFMPEGGALAFVSSMSSTRAVENQTVYGASKAALNQFVAGAACELGPKGIRVNAVSPGFVRTPRLVAALGDDFWAELNCYIPVGRPCEPADIAGPLMFLCSDLAACISGQTLTVDGGTSTQAHMPKIPLKRKATGATA